eukprot:CAMPEP_0114128684 /NCGR_PEP_ID=MMETSP0043_2-20121206/11065_1 /TAXON_ID=464988 /ORGANISM="Hemiselmis andersenii, Strain CCMP644" /LENGTH=69 /DNA_ID=CAMNT_0001221893 /DNA_START=73 /DNA_END=279 /DNA_ORIENTATION=-
MTKRTPVWTAESSRRAPRAAAASLAFHLQALRGEAVASRAAKVAGAGEVNEGVEKAIVAPDQGGSVGAW